jgi:hypothetical protein
MRDGMARVLVLVPVRGLLVVLPLWMCVWLSIDAPKSFNVASLYRKALPNWYPDLGKQWVWSA